jgi:hypothetical protein
MLAVSVTMTNITQTLAFRNGRLNGLVRPLRRLQLSGCEYLLDHWNELAEQIGLPKGVPAGQPYLAFRLGKAAGRGGWDATASK